MEWNPLQHPDIIDGYDISPYGDIRYNKSSLTYKASYHSSNGYDYALFINKNNNKQLFPIDEIVAMVYISVPHELCGKPVTVKHINGDNRDISLSNLEWIEDIEIWKDLIYREIKPNKYEISSRGNLRDKTNKIIKLYIDRDGYKRYTLLTIDNIWKSGIGEHQLVCHMFVKNESSERNVVNHIDGIKHHNIYKNLEWVNTRDNIYHALQTGLRKSGENHCWSKFSNDDIELICSTLVKYNGNVKSVLKELSDRIEGLNRWIISVIKCKKSQCLISDKYFKYDDFKHIKKKYLDESLVRQICVTLVKHNGGVQLSLNDLHSQGFIHITKNHISKIKYKYIWEYISDNYFKYTDGKFIIKS